MVELHNVRPDSTANSTPTTESRPSGCNRVRRSIPQHCLVINHGDVSKVQVCFLLTTQPLPHVSIELNPGINLTSAEADKHHAVDLMRPAPMLRTQQGLWQYVSYVFFGET